MGEHWSLVSGVAQSVVWLLLLYHYLSTLARSGRLMPAGRRRALTVLVVALAILLGVSLYAIAWSLRHA